MSVMPHVPDLLLHPVKRTGQVDDGEQPVRYANRYREQHDAAPWKQKNARQNDSRHAARSPVSPVIMMAMHQQREQVPSHNGGEINGQKLHPAVTQYDPRPEEI